MNTQEDITLFHLETLYKIMHKRMGKGYSPSELSFLIGRHPAYIQYAERLVAPMYTAADLENIAAALEEKSAADIVAVADDEDLITISVQWYEEEDMNYISYTSINERQHEYKLFLLKEDVASAFRNDAVTFDALEVTRNIIRVMVEAGYFCEKRNPLQIFLAVKPLLTFPYLRPEFLQTILEEFCLEDIEDAILREVEYDGFCCGYQARACYDQCQPNEI